jgi:hypothetical protein
MVRERYFKTWETFTETIAGSGSALTAVRVVQFMFAATASNDMQTGVECKYRHALPPGFILKSQRKKEEEEKEKVTISLEEFLEVEVRTLPWKYSESEADIGSHNDSGTSSDRI